MINYLQGWNRTIYEESSSDLQSDALPLMLLVTNEKGIEPLLEILEISVLPLHYSLSRMDLNH